MGLPRETGWLSFARNSLSVIIATVIVVALGPVGSPAVYADSLPPSQAEPSLEASSREAGLTASDIPPLQFTSAGHMLLFDSEGVVIASASHMLKTAFVGANAVVPSILSAGNADDGSSWGPMPLSEVTYENLWDGVTVVYEAAGDAIVKSTYHLDDGNRADSIALRYNRPVSLDDFGNLLIEFDGGVMQECAPTAWQEVPDGRSPVGVSFVLRGDKDVGFALDSYVPGVPVVIDPWLTFLGGGSSSDYGNAIALDGSGNVYVAGYSHGTWGDPVQEYRDFSDAFAAKLDSDGNLIWNTFMGSGGPDMAYAIAVDAGGNAYVAGASWESWGDPVLPFTAGYAAYVARLDSSGNLIWNTFLGGGGNFSYAVVVGEGGNVYVAGHSAGTWGEPVRPIYPRGNDAFAAELDGSGNLIWNTFFGEGGDDAAKAIAVDGSGNVYVSGYTAGPSWGDPVRPYTSGDDVFAVKLDGGGNLLWNTFLGGSGTDRGHGIAVNGDGDVYVAGSSEAAWGDPVRSYASDDDAFVARLDSNGNLMWNTFLGGVDDDCATGCCITALQGNIYIVGYSYASWGEPLRPLAGSSDAFAAKLDGSGSITWHTFLGGAGSDRGHAIAVDTGGEACVAGYSFRTWGAPVRPYAENGDGFVATLDSNGSGPPETVTLELEAGWNMVSVPVLAADMSTGVIFEGTEAVYTWDAVNKSYVTPIIVEPERSYWVAVAEPKTITIIGVPVVDWELQASSGWNMAGSVYFGPQPVAQCTTTEEPDPIQRNAIYWWNPGAKTYESVVEFERGKGYWVASTADCTVSLGPP